MKSLLDIFLSKNFTKSHRSDTVWPEPIWIKVKIWWQILPQHQSSYLTGTESASIEIPSFRPHFIKILKTVFYEVNLTSQLSHLEVLLLSKFCSEKGGFQLMQILDLLGMYFGAAVVFVTNFSLLFKLVVAILCPEILPEMVG